MNNQQIKKAVGRFMDYPCEIKSLIGTVKHLGKEFMQEIHATAMFEYCLQDSKPPEFCCEYSWLAAKEAAWQNRGIQCLCDHYKYCEQCYPLDFREGGKWHKYDPEKPKSTALCIGDPTNPRDDSDHLQDSVEAEPILYVRFRNGKIDWSEDCVSIDTACADEYIENASDNEVYEAVALYRHSTNTKEEDAKILEALKLADDYIGDIQEYNVPQWILSNIESAIQILQERLKC